MRVVVIMLAIVAVSLSSSASEPKGKITDKGAKVPKYDVRTFYDTTTYFGASFSGDEKRLLITSDASGNYGPVCAYIPYTGTMTKSVSGGPPTYSAAFKPSWKRIP